MDSHSSALSSQCMPYSYGIHYSYQKPLGIQTSKLLILKHGMKLVLFQELLFLEPYLTRAIQEGHLLECSRSLLLRALVTR